MLKKVGIIAVAALAVVGCQATPLSSEASKILLSPNPPPKGCKYLGAVTGNQGNFFTGGFTSNKNMEQGAINDLRNQAATLGANYVQLLTNRAGVTGGGNGAQAQTNVTATGNAYKCNNLDA